MKNKLKIKNMNKIKILLIFNLWFLATLFCNACVCDLDVLKDCIHADFIAEVKIIKTYPNDKTDYHFYKIDIEPIVIYKGKKHTSLYVYGSNGSAMRTSCDLDVPINTTWLVYATKSKNGNYEFGMCTSSRELGISRYDSIKLDKKGIERNKRRDQRERLFLDFFNENQNAFDKNKAISDASIIGLYQFLKTYKGVKFENDFGSYKIIFNKDYTVKKVVILKKFEKAFDKKLVETIKKLKFDYLKRSVKNIKEGAYIPLVITYYEEETFLSHYIL
jgi:hypothetical protein